MTNIILICAYLTYSAWAGPAKETAVIFHPVGEIVFGGKGGWDDLTFDGKSHRLFVSHADRIVIIDTEKLKVVKEVPGTPGIHGIALSPELNKAFSSNGKENSVSIFDLDTFVLRSKVMVGENPDAIVYEPKSQCVYAFNGRGNSVSIINAKTEKTVSTLKLPGKPEFAVVDSLKNRIFVNIEDKNEIVAIDTLKQSVAARWPLAGCESPTGIAIDRKNQRLFSVCENEKMVMVSATDGKIFSTAPTGAGTDGAGFDDNLSLAFSSNGKSGTVTVIREDSANRISVVQTLKTKFGARTLTLDQTHQRIFLPTAQFHPVKIGQRAQPIDDTQKVLVFELGSGHP